MTFRSSRFRSGLERELAAACAENGVLFEYEPEAFGYVVHKTYTPDFKFVDCSGEPFYIETKGFFRKENMHTLKAFRLAHPDIRVIVALQSPKARVAKTGKITNAEWCERYSFAWCPTPVPHEFLLSWLQGKAYSYDYDRYAYRPKHTQLSFR